MSGNETLMSHADLGMHYNDLPFKADGYKEFDDMMQRFARTFGCAEQDENGEYFTVWSEFLEEDRNAN